MVIPQHATKSLAACNLAGSATHLVAWFDDPVAEPLMISFSMIMGNDFLLTPVDPACQEEEQQLPRLQKRLHISPNAV